jgi:hypothetical protein
MTSTPVPDDDRLAFTDEDEVVGDDLHTIPADADEADGIEQHQELPFTDEDAAPGSGS